MNTSYIERGMGQSNSRANSRTKIDWKDDVSGKNSIMLCARKLSIFWSEDPRYWTWELETDKTSGKEINVEVAVLKQVWWFQVETKLKTEEILEQGVKYRVFFVVLLKNTARGWDNTRITLKLELLDRKEEKNETSSSSSLGKDESYFFEKDNNNNIKKVGWIDIPVGEVEYGSGNIQISMLQTDCTFYKTGIVIKGIKFTPI